jgi:hypothetical protein
MEEIINKNTKEQSNNWGKREELSRYVLTILELCDDTAFFRLRSYGLIRKNFGAAPRSQCILFLLPSPQADAARPAQIWDNK